MPERESQQRFRRVGRAMVSEIRQAPVVIFGTFEGYFTFASTLAAGAVAKEDITVFDAKSAGVLATATVGAWLVGRIAESKANTGEKIQLENHRLIRQNDRLRKLVAIQHELLPPRIRSKITRK